MDLKIETLVQQVAVGMGDQLTAVYLFGSYTQTFYQPGESDINLLFVIADDADIHLLREVFLPLWQANQTWLRRGPWVARESSFERHKRLNPDFAHHLLQNGRLLHGFTEFEMVFPTLDPHEIYARYVTRALTASNALLPDLMEPSVAENRRLELRRLARQLWRQPIPEEETAVLAYARVQHVLGSKIAQLPAARVWTNTEIPALTAPFLPGLQSLYQQGSNIVMVLAHLSPQDVRRTKWADLTERLADECAGLVITTAVQLSLSLVYDNPLGLILRKYQHNWGMNPLADLQTSPRQVMRQTASFPSNVEIIELPQAYLTQDDTHLHTIVHDFQNRLLNLQLEHELLHRFGFTEKFVPPMLLPDRHTPLPQRIEAIFQHLCCWADFYTDKLNQAEG